MFRIVSSGLTDVGLKRTNNEDALAMEPELGFWTVADGLGGAAAGEVASGIFMDTARAIFSQDRRGARPVDLVRKAFGLANDKILGQAKIYPSLAGMGCTAELITFSNEDYLLGHVGDSRTYILRHGQLRQITRDHSFVQNQVEKGLLTYEQARQHAHKNLILRAVGVSESLAVDFLGGKVMADDIFLLCSDGLTGMVDDETIRATLLRADDIPIKCERLVQLAREAGGHDNITVILCQALSY